MTQKVKAVLKTCWWEHQAASCNPAGRLRLGLQLSYGDILSFGVGSWKLGVCLHVSKATQRKDVRANAEVGPTGAKGIGAAPV